MNNEVKDNGKLCLAMGSCSSHNPSNGAGSEWSQQGCIQAAFTPLNQRG